ncbi:hypothetical protein, partial [Inquilinus sp.]|uniref:hypothetical protein n=1 Tax=Inquilinus sp. TaxID=1932117 RepID=UPI0031DE5985
MVDGAVNAGTPAAASPATGQAGRYAEVLAELTEMALELARAFKGTALAAVRAGDLDRAAVAEAGFNRTALGIRRAVALDARLRQQREEAKHKAETRRQQRQEEKNDRRCIVAETLSRAIAAGKPEAKERLTADLWSRLAEDDRIDADLADTALPIETLALRLGRQLGLSRRAVAAGLGPKEKAGPARAAPKPWDEIPAAPVIPADAQAEDLHMPPPLDASRIS